MALRNDDRVKRACGRREALLAAKTALEPVASAMRSRALDTAGAVAPEKGIRPRATRRAAIVLDVPITPHVPACLDVRYEAGGRIDICGRIPLELVPR